MRHLAKQRDASFFVLFFKTCQYGVLTIIANNFNDDNMFTMSVYSMNADKDDEYSEANFLEFFKKDYQLRTNGENNFLDEDVALAIMNRVYGTYIQIYKYRIQVKMEKAQDYIDQKLQLVSNSISKHKL